MRQKVSKPIRKLCTKHKGLLLRKVKKLYLSLPKNCRNIKLFITKMENKLNERN